MADILNAQRMRLWNGTKDVGFAGVADADNDGGLYVRQHDGVNLLGVPAEDAVAGAGATGLIAMAVRDDAGGTRVSADGDFSMLSLDAMGQLRVTGGTGGTSETDGGAFTFGTTPGTPASFVVDDVATVAVAENSQGVARMSTARVILTHVADPTTPTQRQDVSATGYASVVSLAEHVEDAVAGATDTGHLMLGIRDDAGGTRVSADGDYHALSINATGELRVTSGASGVADDSAFTFTTTPVQPSGFVFDDVATNAVTENNVAAARISGNRILLTHIADPVTDTQRLSISAAGAASVNLDQVLGATHSATNPVFVSEGDPTVSGNEVHDYDTATVVKGATGNHDLVAVATLLVEQIIVAASGAGRWEVINDALVTPVTVATIFTSGSQLTEEVTFKRPISVAAGDTLRIARQNDDNADMDMYSTIIGVDA